MDAIPVTGLNRRDFLRTVSTAAAAAAIAHEAGAARQGAGESAWQGANGFAVPERLSARTRELAAIALRGDHGRALVSEEPLRASELAGLTKNQAYAVAARRAAETAPIRLIPGELIVGSATLRAASYHQTPFLGISSTSHTTIGFDRVLKSGYKGLRERIEARLARGAFEHDAPTEWTPPLLAVCDGRSGAAYAGHPAGGHWLWGEADPALAEFPLTVECWARLDSASFYNILVAHHTKASPDHWELFTPVSSGKLAAYLPGYAPTTFISDRVVTDGKWHHFSMILEPDGVRLCVDGEEVLHASMARGAFEVVASETSDGMGDTGGGICVGAFPPGVGGLHGAVEQVHIRRGAHVERRDRFTRDAETLALWDLGTAEGRGGLTVYPVSHSLRPSRHNGRDLLTSMLGCLDAAETFHRRYMEALDARIASSDGAERETWQRVRTALARVPENPPETFHEAVQSLWFMYAFQRLMGTWSGIGRIDAMLGPYLERDLAEGRITLDEAREILAHFWIKGVEWTGFNTVAGSGDAQFYQNIILSGVDEDGRDLTNPVTYLVLDIVEELHISDFPIAVRLNRSTPTELLRRMAEVQRHGGGIVAMYNEEVVIDGLVKFGYSLRDARRFTNDGCWEILVPGETAFLYSPFDALGMLHEVLGIKTPDAPAPEFATFEELYAAWRGRIAAHLEGHHRAADGMFDYDHPSPLVSMFVDDCIERGLGYYERGARYTVAAPHAGGMANVADSLLVLDRLVYQERALSLAEFVEILRNDWQGQEHLRRSILSRFAFYGNDDDAADAMMQRVFDDYAALVAELPERNGVLRPAGLSTFGREIEWAAATGPRTASPDGNRLGAVLATNFSPSPGADRRGPSAVLQSYCKMDFTKTPNGATVELKIHPESVRGEEGVEAMVGLMRAFVRLGGMFLHIDVADSALLRDAQEHPERYPNLAVRIAGWSARFVTINKQWQDMIIARTQQYV